MGFSVINPEHIYFPSSSGCVQNSPSSNFIHIKSFWIAMVSLTETLMRTEMHINYILYEVKCNKQWEKWRQTSHGSVRAVATTNSMVLITFLCHWFILLFDINTFEKRTGLIPLEKQKYSFFSILFLQIRSENSWWFEIIQTTTNLHFHVNPLNKVLLVPYPPNQNPKEFAVRFGS